MIKDKIESIKKRIAHLEPEPIPPLEWPPRQGSFSYCIWESLGKPMEPRRSFDEFYNLMAEVVWKRKDETVDRND